MSAAKHTPGPWSGGKDIPVRAFDTEALGFSIIYINTSSSARKEVSMANARLIHTAPEMLAELREIVEWARIEQAPLREQEIASIQRLIAKATGEQP